MEFKEEFEKVYLRKDENTREALDTINEFCSFWDGKAEIESIPLIMKLYCDDADTCEQNEFVSCLIDSLVSKEPQRGLYLIVNNIDVLEKENASECISELMSVMIFWNEEYVPLLANALLKAEECKRNIIFNELNNELNESWTDDEMKTLIKKIFIIFQQESENI